MRPIVAPELERLEAAGDADDSVVELPRTGTATAACHALRIALN